MTACLLIEETLFFENNNSHLLAQRKSVQNSQSLFLLESFVPLTSQLNMKHMKTIAHEALTFACIGHPLGHPLAAGSLGRRPGGRVVGVALPARLRPASRPRLLRRRVHLTLQPPHLHVLAQLVSLLLLLHRCALENCRAVGIRSGEEAANCLLSGFHILELRTSTPVSSCPACTEVAQQCDPRIAGQGLSQSTHS